MSIKDQSIKQYSLFRRFQSDIAIRLVYSELVPKVNLYQVDSYPSYLVPTVNLYPSPLVPTVKSYPSHVFAFFVFGYVATPQAQVVYQI